MGVPGRRERTREVEALVAEYAAQGGAAPGLVRKAVSSLPSAKPSSVQRRATALMAGCGACEEEEEEEEEEEAAVSSVLSTGFFVHRLEQAESRLRELGADYASPVAFDEAGMSDGERDALEQRLGQFLVDCERGLQDLARRTGQSAHDQGVIQVVLSRAQAFSGLFDDLQRLRYNRDLAARRSLTAPCEGTALTFARADEDDEAAAATLSQAESAALAAMRRRAVDYAPPPPEAAGKDKTAHLLEEVAPRIVETHLASMPEVVQPPPRGGREGETDEGVAERRQQQQMLLRTEKDVLTAELEGELDAAKRIESRMESVSQLMSTFSSLVEEQQQTIAGLFETVEETSELIDRGGDELDRAAKRKSTFPVFFNTIVLAAALALLFLHWIKP